ncbi:carcinoembryonic antigen-related cell adhesion molecule 4 [Octodon degus]|uniref:Carcinoembryonic antigen-related cell adhesion molecule 4 n=1 Tax=Octodon degus TaxID=10160 RepID=A0A6P6DWQ9_OCTDE|nr:carcinoembryonic antigen-related cell adhesion molecule 4 [Octodon degus]
MEPRSATSHRGLVPWQGLLLAASLLTSWTPPTPAQVTIQAVPFHAAEGGDVLLLACNVPENSIAYKWFKGEGLDLSNEIAAYAVEANNTLPGRAYSHRETIYHNGSLLFQNIKEQDSGFYTLQVIKSNYLVEVASGLLLVHKSVTWPSILASSTTVAEGDSVALTCLSGGDTETSIQWIFNDQHLQLTEHMKLSQNSILLLIDYIRREDAGEYRCEVFGAGNSSRSDPLRLEVNSEERNPGLPAGAIAGLVFGVAVAVVLGCFLLFTRTRRSSVQHDLQEHRKSVSNPSLSSHNSFTLQDTVPSTQAAVPIYEELLNPEMNVYCKINPKADAAS